MSRFCPHGCGLSIVTRTSETNKATRRDRRCRKCGHTWYTLETTRGEFAHVPQRKTLYVRQHVSPDPHHQPTESDQRNE